ncbi:hypothetical protein F5X98DRAFT_340758 [Xylaria grammica]|nr:hypothetical protein F5X98DRAFT_340758 [Xylaria grammica]
MPPPLPLFAPFLVFFLPCLTLIVTVAHVRDFLSQILEDLSGRLLAAQHPSGIVAIHRHIRKASLRTEPFYA